MPHLPDELLLDLFELVPSRNDLTQVSYSCKTFATVVKPLIYSHVMIEDKKQCEKLRAINQEDAKLVKHVSIMGNFNVVWSSNVEELVEDFARSSLEDDSDEGESTGAGLCRVGAGTVQGLLEGKLFNAESVEKIVGRDIQENPHVELRKPVIIPSILKNFHTLSIATHRGAARLWTAVLRKRHLPSLRRLGIHDVTAYNVSSVGGRGRLAEIGATESVLAQTDLLDQLQILASPVYGPFLRDYPQLVHLAIVSGKLGVSDSIKYATIVMGSHYNDLVDETVVQRLTSIIAEPDKAIRLEYISVAGYMKSFSNIHNRPQTISAQPTGQEEEDKQEKREETESKGEESTQTDLIDSLSSLNLADGSVPTDLDSAEGSQCQTHPSSAATAEPLLPTPRELYNALLQSVPHVYAPVPPGITAWLDEDGRVRPEHIQRCQNYFLNMWVARLVSNGHERRLRDVGISLSEVSASFQVGAFEKQA
ncbi:uncharacterized protein JCM6883_001471 [Sporobolomyces salmoneus]|uniref:uncharacterized protein n=1 Tax=Sporobolomyces salmoneus TaxID=183962 RepID=UPI00317D0DC9